MEIQQVCKEGKHRFASEGRLTITTCPYCKTEMHLEIDTKAWEESFGKKLKSGIEKGLSRGKLIDSLPRMPWFGDALEDKELNNPDQSKSHTVWTEKDDEELAGLFAENGISTHGKWASVAAKVGRSLFSIERQLRVIYARKEYELDEFCK